MAVRLSVVMVHSPPAGSQAQRKGEEVVGELIGLAGIDLTLVAAFEGLHKDSTDHLSLTSLTGDMAVLDWRTPAELIQVLHGIEIPGARSPHPHDPEVPVPASDERRIYAFDLNQFSAAKDLTAALQELKSQREVRTFSLQDLLPGSKDHSAKDRTADKNDAVDQTIDRSRQAAQSPDQGESRPDSTRPDGARPDSARPDGARRGPGAPAGARMVADSNSADSRPSGLPGVLDLDDLLDQLDELDP